MKTDACCRAKSANLVANKHSGATKTLYSHILLPSRDQTELRQQLSGGQKDANIGPIFYGENSNSPA